MGVHAKNAFGFPFFEKEGTEDFQALLQAAMK
jgi:hypothetical protein